MAGCGLRACAIGPEKQDGKHEECQCGRRQKSADDNDGERTLHFDPTPVAKASGVNASSATVAVISTGRSLNIQPRTTASFTVSDSAFS